VLPHERVLFWSQVDDSRDRRGRWSSPGGVLADLKRYYMELRPNLRRVYSPVIDIACFAPLVTPLGFAPIEQAQQTLGGTTYYTAMLDFGPTASTDGWAA
jgi:hypothetical protein